jgi:glycine/D-amino acid oxidase-like deaminating enzyme
LKTVWDIGAQRPKFATLQEDRTVDLCVIGLGGSGLTAINESLARGLSVIGIDAGDIAGEAAGRNGGFLLAGIAQFHHEAVANFGRERARALYQHTLDEMSRMDSATPESIKQIGGLRIAFDDEEFADCIQHLGSLKIDGFPGEEYEGPEGRGILIPTDGVFHPLNRAISLVQEALAAGAELFTNTKALSVESNFVATPHGKIEAKNILVAIDGNLALLLPQLKDDIYPVRLQMLSTTPERSVHFPRPVYTRSAYDYWQQLPDGRISIGGGRDIGGEEEDTNEVRTTEKVQNFLDQRIRELGITADVEHRWAATVSYTKSGLPIAREVTEGVYAIGAYCGTGNVVGALLGRAMVENISTGKSQIWSDFSHS